MRRMTTVLVWLGLCAIAPLASAQTLNLSVEPVGPSPLIVLPGGGGFSARVILDTDQIVQGWSYGICNDDTIAVLDAATDGATTLIVNDGDPPAFNDVSVFPNGVSAGVVISLTGAATLPAGTGYELQILDYSIAAGVVQPVAGDPDIVSMVAPCDTVGAPPVATVIVVNGASLVPVQTGFDLIVPAAAECDFSCVAGVDNVDITWNNCNPGGPADYYMLFRDGILLNVFDDGTQAFSDTGLAPGSYHYELLAVSFPDPTGPPSILQGSCDADVIPVTLGDITPVVGIYQGGTMLTITGTGFAAAVDTTITIGGQTALDIMVIDDNTLTCVTPPVTFIGSVDVELSNTFGSDIILDGFLYGFRRGLISDDLDIDLADPIFALDYLFGGGATPFCLDAVDTNDDGQLDIGDGIYLLNFLFMAGTEPPPPFTEAGLDPTADGIDCGLPQP